MRLTCPSPLPSLDCALRSGGLRPVDEDEPPESDEPQAVAASSTAAAAATWIVRVRRTRFSIREGGCRGGSAGVGDLDGVAAVPLEADPGAPVGGDVLGRGLQVLLERRQATARVEI